MRFPNGDDGREVAHVYLELILRWSWELSSKVVMDDAGVGNITSLLTVAT